MKNPRDRLGNELQPGDIVHVKCEELIAEVVDVKCGGVLTATDPLPAVVTVVFSIKMPPGSAHPDLLKLCRPDKKEKPVLAEA